MSACLHGVLSTVTVRVVECDGRLLAATTQRCYKSLGYDQYRDQQHANCAIIRTTNNPTDTRCIAHCGDMGVVATMESPILIKFLECICIMHM